MTAAPAELLAAAYLLLADLGSRRVQPTEADLLLAELEQNFPERHLTLLWSAETSGDIISYDLLIRASGTPAILLSIYPEQEAPWVLRVLHKWTDQELVRVNNRVVTVQQAIASLELDSAEGNVTHRIVNACLIEDGCDEFGIRVTDAEVENALWQFLDERDLSNSEIQREWLRTRGLSISQVEQHLRARLRVQKLAVAIWQSIEGIARRERSQVNLESDGSMPAEVKPPYSASPFKASLFASKSIEVVRHVIQVHRTDLVPLYRAVEDCLVQCSLPEKDFSFSLGYVDPEQLPADAWEALGAPVSLKVIGPYLWQGSFRLIQPLEVRAYPGHTQRDLLLRQWLTQRRGRADIEWNWAGSSTGLFSRARLR